MAPFDYRHISKNSNNFIIKFQHKALNFKKKTKQQLKIVDSYSERLEKVRCLHLKNGKSIPASVKKMKELVAKL